MTDGSWEIRRAMKDSNSMLLGGGGLFQDRTSLRSCLLLVTDPYGPYLFRKVLGRLTVIGTVQHDIGPLFCKNAFGKCVYRNVRNRSSLGMLNNWGFFGTQSPDLVMSLKVKRDFEKGDRLLLNLRTGYEKVSGAAVSSAVKAAEQKGLKIFGVAFADDDIKEFEKYVSKGTLKLDQITVVRSLSQFENILSRSCCAIGMRLHFLVLALLAGPCCAGRLMIPKWSRSAKNGRYQ